MALSDLFKSQKERDKEAAVKKRRAFREAERAADVVKDRIAVMRKDRDKAWAQARQYLKDGQKAAAQRLVQSCRANEMLMAKLETKRWVFDQLLSKLELAKSDQDFANALKAVNTVVEIDPEATADVLGEVEEKLGEQVDTDKIWAKMYDKEMVGVETQMEDAIPTLEELERQLEDEVAAEIGEGQHEKNDRISSDVKEKIGEGRRRLKDLLGGEK